MRRLLIALLSVIYAPALVGCGSDTGSTLSQEEWHLWYDEYRTFTPEERAGWCYAWDTEEQTPQIVDSAAKALGIPRWKTTTMMNIMCD